MRRGAPTQHPICLAFALSRPLAFLANGSCCASSLVSSPASSLASSLQPGAEEDILKSSPADRATAPINTHVFASTAAHEERSSKY